ncbi:MAG: MG2 domain-containing protein [Solirubrobacteraceae bacterium]
MKNINIFAMILFSQFIFSQDFSEQWKTVHEHESKQKIKSAIKVVDEILVAAKNSKNEQEIVKCFFYKSKYMQTVEEDAQTKIFTLLESTIKSVSEPTQAILELIYADALKDYYNNNSWQIRNRTSLIEQKDKDFKTWTTKDFYEKINQTFQELLKKEKILNTVSIYDYHKLFEYNPHSDWIKRSVYDFVLEQAIYFYQKNDINLTENYKKIPTDKINKSFYDEKLFVLEKFDFEDQRLTMVLELLQKREKLVQDSEGEKEVFWQRFNSIHEISSNETLYFEALNNVITQNKNNWVGHEAQFKLASYYFQKADKKENKDFRKKALELCNAILNNTLAKEVKKDAENLKNSILNQVLSIQTPNYVLPNEPILAKVTYQNIQEYQIKILELPLDYTGLDRNRYENDKNEKYLKLAKDLKVFKTLNLSINDLKDYFSYNKEIILPALPIGKYLFHVSTKAINGDKVVHSFEEIQATFLNIVKHQNKNLIYEIKNSKTGKPLNDVKVYVNGNQINTDVNGLAKIIDHNNDREVRIKFEKDNDVVFLKDYFYSLNENPQPQDYKDLKITILTDRAIYRPGQTVLFKAIATKTNEEIHEVIPNLEFNMIGQDANGKEIYKKFLTTNEMGSISGEFILPKDVLTGNFTLKVQENKQHLLAYKNSNNRYYYFATSFKVEEYKRPKFEVTFQDQKESKKLNETITTKGIAKAYAGNFIADAEVKYTVIRKIQKRWDYWYYRGGNGANENDETIINSTTKTDAIGNFNIEFLAKAGNQDPKNNPIYIFEIKADVTDSNGETQSNTTTVKAGFNNWDLSIEHPKTVEKNNKNIFKINTKNLNGIEVPTDGVFSMYKLKSPDRLLLYRPWESPEIQEINKEDYVKNFPFYPYNKEDKKENWERGVAVFSKNINTGKEKEILFENVNTYITGSYMVEFVIKDTDGKEIKTQSFLDIINANDIKPADFALFEANITNKDFKKDTFIEINTKTNYKNLVVSVEAFYESKSIFKEILTIEDSKNFKIPVTNVKKGDVLIEIDFVVEGQYFEKVLNANVTIDEPKLSIKTNTFRNKLEPGKDEKWSFNILSEHTPKLAEVLASMYDASLDKFHKLDWNDLLFLEKQIYNSGNNKNNRLVGNSNFSVDFPDFDTKFRKYFKDELNLYGFGINYSNFYHNLSYDVSNYKKGVEIVVSGLITEGKIGKLGVKVELIGTDKFVISDKNGNYKIKAKTGDVLRFSYLGLNPIKKIITGNILNIDFKDFTNYIVKEEYDVEDAFMSTGSAPRKARMMSQSVSAANISMDSGGFEEKERGFISKDTLSNGKIIERDFSEKNNSTNDNFPKIRTNFSETAFFYPHLTTDTKGNINFEFKTPDALTQWKLRLLAHNKNGVSAYHEDFAVTQKELMVTPNMPRFLREKDTIVLKTKITNLSTNAQKGKATLKLFNALDRYPIDVEMQNQNAVQNFEINANGNTTMSWKVFIPNGLQGVQYQVLAQTETHSDGEENILPVLPNSMLVTESKPIWVRENSEKTFTFNNFKDNNSNTLRHHLMTLEYTSNPTWLAIQSLPYLMEYEHECAEQTFARYYANVLATEVINSQPKIKEVFDLWKKQGKPTSKLSQNEELKSIILAETPWLKDMENEAEQRKNLALLFDLEQMKTSTDATLNKLKAKQKSNGAFAWFDGGYENRYITQHIVSGIGHLEKLIKNNALTNDYKSITDNAIPFLDQEFIKDHERRKEISTQNKGKKEPRIWINPYNELHYFYARSFYLQKNPISAKQKAIFKEYLDQIKTQWKEFSLYEKAMAALVLHRFEDKETPQDIITAFKETSSNNEEWGMYWINNKNSWYWYQSPIETQALIIEAFTEIANDTQSADLMKVWLLKNKQTKSWSNTKTTTEAVYALLLQGSDFVNVKNETKITWGNTEKLNLKLQENPEEVGSGYIKINYKKEEIQPELATLTIKNDNKVPGFGGLYWQYFEELDKIKSSENGPMKMQKELYIKKVVGQDKPLELEKITNTSNLKIGDRVTVRIIVSTTEDIDFVHLKDMRASCFEPVDVISSYQWQNGLGYYKSTKDAATHFFFDKINKGTYVLEYELLVNNNGNFSNGISTLQSMYAPEYSHHTGGVRVKVE